MTSLFRKLQYCNALFFLIIGIQLIIGWLHFGWTAVDYLPVAGISFFLATLYICAAVYEYKRGFSVLIILLDFVIIAALIVLTLIFSGPFDRLFQGFLLFLASINIVIVISRITKTIFSFRKSKSGSNTEANSEISALKSQKLQKSQKAALISMVITLAFTIGAIFNFGYTYEIRAPDEFTTRSSYWGTPYINETIVSHDITPINNHTLFISNSSLGINVENLQEGGLLYVINVSHISNPLINYCNYLSGAQSFPNGTVILSQDLPNLTDVSVSFVYMSNINVMKYLQQSDSRIISTNWGNYTWIASPNLFHSISNTYQYLLFEYWNLSYYINIDVPGLKFPHMFNAPAFVARGIDTINRIDDSQPNMAHCVGISYDFEKDNITDEAIAPEHPPIGEPIAEGIVDLKGYYKYNEQYEVFLDEVKAEYFALYDYMQTLGYEAYITYQYSAIEDLSDGDIDWTRLPMWQHPACEYGMMSYQDGESIEDAYWMIYSNNKNQQAIYGEKGHTILTGWLDDTDENYLDYYTNDEMGLERYIHDIKVHQACGVQEIFHAYLYRMQMKWGDEAILRVEEALNQDPKETYSFKADTWSDFESHLYDAIENYNKLAITLPTLIIFLVVLTFPEKNYRTKNEK